MISAVSIPTSLASKEAIPSPLKWWKHSAIQALHVFDGEVQPSRDLELDSMPDSVARPLAVMRNPRAPVAERLASARTAAQEMLRVGGTLLMADYLDCETVCSRIERTLPQMQNPDWPEWLRLCQWLCFFFNRDLPERPGRTTRFPRLVAGLREITNSPQGPLRDLLRAAPEPPPARPGRHMAVARQLHGVLALVNHMSRSLFLPRRFSIMKLITEAPARVYLLHGHGELSSGPAREEWLPALRDAGSVVLVGDMVLPLYSMATIQKLGMEGARLAMAWTRLERPDDEEDTLVDAEPQAEAEPEPSCEDTDNRNDDEGLWDVAWVKSFRDEADEADQAATIAA